MSLARAFRLAFAQLGDRAILRVLAKSVAATLAIFAALGALLALVVAPWLASYAGQDSTVFMIAGLLLAAVAGYILFRVVALAVIQLFADDVVAAVEARHYPGSQPRQLGFREEAANGLKGALRALLVNLAIAPVAIVLLVTGVGTVILFWAVNAWLLGRELQDMVWLRHRAEAQTTAPLGWPTRFALGGVVAGLLMIPLLNLLAPILGAAAATHLVHARHGGTAHA